MNKNVLISVAILFALGCAHTFKSYNSKPLISRHISSEADLYSQNVQPVFNNRCIACHSCMESPCQLNLQSYEGLVRGVHKENVYGSNRLKSAAPNRMYEDAQTAEEWRQKGFHDILGNSEKSVLTKVLELGQSSSRTRVTKNVEQSQVCMNQSREVGLMSKMQELAMPYGFKGISNQENAKILDWINAGAPPPQVNNPVKLSPAIEDQVEDWTEFFNQSSIKGKITARYLYEHLFLAHLYFDESPREFLKLIRSSTPCENPKIISTRTPNSDPKVKTFYYCFVKELGTVVSKNHIPYRLSADKLEWLSAKFMGSDWNPQQLPSYEPEIATNPFRTFRDIPVKVRYEFLLEDARYHVMTFIKGPVCHGSVALNSIQEQFFVFFMKPESDLMVRSSEYAETFEKTSDLPGQWGDLVPLQNTLPVYSELLKKRNTYRQRQNSMLRSLSPLGLSLDDIWDGNETNTNAVLTVFRHDDNASVVTGASGDLSKTAFMLDYSTFERLCYNLVVNFDVYGSLGHQFLTRLYMDLIRMDSENNYLNFLPQDARKKVKNSWYQGALTQIKLNALSENQFPDIPNRIEFKNKSNPHLELTQRILFERMKPNVLVKQDLLNWKQLAVVLPQDTAEFELRKLTAIKAGRSPFPIYFPEFSLLFVGQDKVFSIIHNREHTNLSWLTNEGKRLSPQEDTLTISHGITSSYPNYFFTVEPENLKNFVEQALTIRNQEDYKRFTQKYGIDRMHTKFWNFYDMATSYFQGSDVVEAGYLDLSRYSL